MTSEDFIMACRFATFLAKYHPETTRWVDPVGYCGWYIIKEYITSIVDDKGDIVALGNARPVEGPGFGAIPFHDAENGPCIHIDLLVIKHNEFTMPGLARMMLLRFGPRKQVSYFRRSEQKLRVHDYDTFLRNVTRLTTKEKRELYEPRESSIST